MKNQDTPKPDPEQFALVVLWHLAGLRADIAQVQVQLQCVLAKQEPETTEANLENHKRLREKLYLEALQEVGLRSSPQPPSLPKGQ